MHPILQKIKMHPTSGMNYSELKECIKCNHSIPQDSIVAGEILEEIYDRLKTYKDGSKMKKTIRNVIVGRDDFGTQHNCLYILYKDKTVDNISANKLFSNSKVNRHPIDARKAARFEILKQVIDFKMSQVDGFEYEADHAYPKTFENLFDQWKKSKSIDDIDIKLTQDSQLNKIFVDKELALCWYEYHKEHAILELVTPEEHKERTRKLKRRSDVKNQKCCLI